MEERTTTRSLGLVINDHQFSPEFVMNLMVNGTHFHSERRLYKTVKELDWLGSQLVHYVLVDYLICATHYVMFLRSVILMARAEGLLRE